MDEYAEFPHCDGTVILEPFWPQDRGVFFVQHADGPCAYVLADHEGDAEDAFAEHFDPYGDDDARQDVSIYRVAGQELTDVLAALEEWIEVAP